MWYRRLIPNQFQYRLMPTVNTTPINTLIINAPMFNTPNPNSQHLSQTAYGTCNTQNVPACPAAFGQPNMQAAVPINNCGAAYSAHPAFVYLISTIAPSLIQPQCIFYNNGSETCGLNHNQSTQPHSIAPSISGAPIQQTPAVIAASATKTAVIASQPNLAPVSLA